MTYTYHSGAGVTPADPFGVDAGDNAFSDATTMAADAITDQRVVDFTAAVGDEVSS